MPCNVLLNRVIMVNEIALLQCLLSANSFFLFIVGFFSDYGLGISRAILDLSPKFFRN